MQNYDGGFPFWQRGYESWPYLTVHVVNALVRAKAKGFAIERGPLDNGLEYLRTIEQRYPYYYGEDIRRTITSYALYTRMLAGDRDVARPRASSRRPAAPTSCRSRPSAGCSARGRQQADAADEREAILRHLDNKVTETAAAANFTTATSDGAYLMLHSDRRVDAVILESLIAEQRDHDLIPKLVVGLLGHAKAGRWESTQENVFVLPPSTATSTSTRRSRPTSSPRSGSATATPATTRSRAARPIASRSTSR
jgi:uncharacterized protein YfaS (alpha-2-macroglobulin family)